MAQITFTAAHKDTIAHRVIAQVGKGKTYENQAVLGRAIGLGVADMTNLFRFNYRDNDQLIGINKWVLLARFVGFSPNEQTWVVAPTAVYDYLTKQLDWCQANAATAILCDEAGIGKTVAARDYTANNTNVFYIDCSVHSGKAAFVRAIARAVGVEAVGKLSEVEANAFYMLNLYEKPLIIFDEAGDLDSTSILVLKRLYNALEGKCGMYLIGADGLESKVNRGINYKKLGYVEVFSRFGKRFQKLMRNQSQGDKITMLREMAECIAVANGCSEAEIDIVVSSVTTDGVINDMRRVAREIKKLQKQSIA